MAPPRLASLVLLSALGAAACASRTVLGGHAGDTAGAPLARAAAEPWRTARQDVRRVRWPQGNVLVFPDSAGAVTVWFASGIDMLQPGMRHEMWATFVPGDVQSWASLTRQLLALERIPASHDSAPGVTSGALRGIRNGEIVVARNAEAERLGTDVRIALTPKPTSVTVMLDLRAADVVKFVEAMEAVATESRYVPVGTPSQSGSKRAGLRAITRHQPHFPDELRKAGQEGEVWFCFVVRDDGRVEQASVETYLSDHPAFEKAVRDWIGGVRFTPATLNGAPTRERACQRYVFALAPDEQ